MLGIDVFNEPHNLFWFSENGDQPAWVDVIAAAASAVYQNNPDLLLFVEGPSSEEAGPAICIPHGQIPEDISAYSIDRNACGNGLDAIHFKSNWGENFRALLDADAAKNSEFKLGGELRSQLLKRLPVEMVNWLLGQPDDSSHNGSHLVFSPHIYGSHVATWQSSPEASPYRFNWNFGFLQDSNYSVVIGETGYLTDQVLDVSFFKDSISPYLIKKNMNHQLFYWTFNSNSGDTGGIRENANTAALVVDKERALHDLFYYKQSSN
ncbi:hypothetical protein AQUSIP_07280 [Aquicella siphonis]|uniref:cellulase n=1 Tax=Aquicella siphonis TaxID=254247 RepID=A0A5E4PG08_9COXI|nr:hypothetical protein AQUSIP_07280 [Aquicella siphonis]